MGCFSEFKPAKGDTSLRMSQRVSILRCRFPVVLLHVFESYEKCLVVLWSVSLLYIRAICCQFRAFIGVVGLSLPCGLPASNAQHSKPCAFDVFNVCPFANGSYISTPSESDGVGAVISVFDCMRSSQRCDYLCCFMCMLFIALLFLVLILLTPLAPHSLLLFMLLLVLLVAPCSCSCCQCWWRCWGGIGLLQCCYWTLAPVFGGCGGRVLSAMFSNAFRRFLQQVVHFGGQRVGTTQ